MNRLFRSALLAAAFTASAASADRPFILPSNTMYSGDANMVTFDAAASEHLFFFDHRALPLNIIKIWKPDGTEGAATNMLQGRLRSVFDLKLDQQGTWKIGSEQSIVMGTFKLNGEERRVGRFGPPRPAAGGGQEAANRPAEGARGPAAPSATGPGRLGEGAPRRIPPVAVEDIPAEATDLHLTELASRTETFVTTGAPTTTIFKPTGKGLEFEPVTHPNALVAGETARFRFLVNGKPAPDLAVTVVPGGDRYREDSGAIQLKTGPDGVVTIRWPTAGMYWIGTEAEDQNPTDKKAETRRMIYSATVEVMTP